VPDPKPHVTVELPWSTLFRIAAIVLAVWVWLRLWQVAVALLVSVVVAVALHPIVAALEARRVPRWLAASAAVLTVAGLMGAFVATLWTSLSAEAALVGASLSQAEAYVRSAVPMLAQVLGQTAAQNQASWLVSSGTAVAASALRALVLIAFGLVLTIYLLIEQEQTREWVVAFAPPRYRARVRRTMARAYEVVLAYVIGNITTATFAMATVYVSLSLLHVPAALLLALLAGLFDFVPLLGFIASAVPALMLAATVSTTAVVAVAVIYAIYHLLENYVIAPRVYGSQLRLSRVAVLVAFAAGAELGGVIGAMLALPIAAIYPALERIWFTGDTARDVAVHHDRLNRAESA
jgi:predicted PurR-regulated permease PerM